MRKKMDRSLSLILFGLTLAFCAAQNTEASCQSPTLTLINQTECLPLNITDMAERTQLVVHVRSARRVAIVLAESNSSSRGEPFKLSWFGRDSVKYGANTKVLLGSSDQCALRNNRNSNFTRLAHFQHNGSILHETQYRAFWLDWADHMTLSVGRGEVIGQDTMLSYNFSYVLSFEAAYVISVKTQVDINFDAPMNGLVCPPTFTRHPGISHAEESVYTMSQTLYTAANPLSFSSAAEEETTTPQAASELTMDWTTDSFVLRSSRSGGQSESMKAMTVNASSSQTTSVSAPSFQTVSPSTQSSPAMPLSTPSLPAASVSAPTFQTSPSAPSFRSTFLGAPGFQTALLSALSFPATSLSSSSFQTAPLSDLLFPTTSASAPSFQTTSASAPSFQTTSARVPSFPTTSLSAPSFPTTSLGAPKFQTRSPNAPSVPTTSLSTPNFPTTSLSTPSFPSTSLSTPSFPSTSLSTPNSPKTSLSTPSFQTISLSAPSFQATSSNAVHSHSTSVSDFSHQMMSLSALNFQTTKWDDYLSAMISMPSTEDHLQESITFPTTAIVDGTSVIKSTTLNGETAVVEKTDVTSYSASFSDLSASSSDKVESSDSEDMIFETTTQSGLKISERDTELLSFSGHSGHSLSGAINTAPISLDEMMRTSFVGLKSRVTSGPELTGIADRTLPLSLDKLLSDSDQSGPSDISSTAENAEREAQTASSAAGDTVVFHASWRTLKQWLGSHSDDRLGKITTENSVRSWEGQFPFASREEIISFLSTPEPISQSGMVASTEVKLEPTPALVSVSPNSMHSQRNAGTARATGSIGNRDHSSKESSEKISASSQNPEHFTKEFSDQFVESSLEVSSSAILKEGTWNTVDESYSQTTQFLSRETNTKHSSSVIRNTGVPSSEKTSTLTSHPTMLSIFASPSFEPFASLSPSSVSSLLTSTDSKSSRSTSPMTSASTSTSSKTSISTSVSSTTTSSPTSSFPFTPPTSMTSAFTSLSSTTSTFASPTSMTSAFLSLPPMTSISTKPTSATFISTSPSSVMRTTTTPASQSSVFSSPVSSPVPSSKTSQGSATSGSNSHGRCRCVTQRPSNSSSINHTKKKKQAEKEMQESVEAICSSLHIPTHNMSATVRKKTSAKDDRKSSIAIGCLWALVSFLPLISIVVSDVIRLVGYVCSKMT